MLQWLFLVVAIGSASRVGIVAVLMSTRGVVAGWIGVPIVLTALYW